MRWTKHILIEKERSDSEYWDMIARQEMKKPFVNRVLREYMSCAMVDLLRSWSVVLKGKRVLKTDLREEAVDDDPFVAQLYDGENIRPDVFGIDISFERVMQARERMSKRGDFNVAQFIVADIRELPFKPGAFDLIISTSTLDHGCRNDLERALAQMKNVLSKQGKAIVSLTNKYSFDCLLVYIIKLCGLAKRLLPYRLSFFSLKESRNIMRDMGLTVSREAEIVHVNSSAHMVLRVLRMILRSQRLVDSVARCLIFLGKRKPLCNIIRFFIVLEIEKRDNG